MKKILLYTLLGLVVLILIIIKPFRTDTVMRNIADNELDDVVFEQYGSEDYQQIIKELRGPNVEGYEDYKKYTWYRMVNHQDTGKIFIKVYRYPKSFSWRDRFYWNKTTMNEHW